MKKLIYLIVLALILGMALTGCQSLSNVGQVPATDQSEVSGLTKGDLNFDAECPAAPAVAGLLLEAADVDNRYGTGKDGGNFIKEVANYMSPEADFNGVSKCNIIAYECEVAAFLNGLATPAGVTSQYAGVLDPEASGATATDNVDGTVTLEITVVNLCGNGIEGLNPLSDFSVSDSVIGGTYYFGTSSIPGSVNWTEGNGVYTVILERNYFNARPAGYDDGWYRIWDIYVQGELVKKDLLLSTTYYAVGDWKMDLFVGTALNKRFIIISTHVNGVIDGFFGVEYNPEGVPTGTITGTIVGQSIEMLYENYDAVYTAEFEGTIADDGNSMSGTWSDYARTDEPWYMERQ